MATRIACLRMTAQHLEALHHSVEHASCLPARSQWDRKAGAHAEIFYLLADVADDPVLAPVLSGSAGTAPRVHVTGGGADEAGGEGKRYE
jgi:hypothetical protein